MLRRRWGPRGYGRGTPRVARDNLKLRSSREGSSLEPPGGGWSCRRLDFGRLAYSTAREHISVILNHKVHGNLLIMQPQETNTVILWWARCAFLKTPGREQCLTQKRWNNVYLGINKNSEEEGFLGKWAFWVYLSNETRLVPASSTEVWAWAGLRGALFLSLMGGREMHARHHPRLSKHFKSPPVKNAASGNKKLWRNTHGESGS